jgi:lipopolysaccharide export system permease protein
MKTIRRLIYGEVLAAIALVALGFLALFFFFDLVDEFQYLGKSNGINAADVYQIRHALLYVGLLIPNHLYELLPISVLIGTIFVMARLAQSSEYTILRTSGLGPWRALKLAAGVGRAVCGVQFRDRRLRGPGERSGRATAQGQATRTRSPSARPARG